ncbi:NUDIX hydrolase [Halovenus rubra]|uniref:NUDIX hydrolase n=2 Tax=Halovenus rubra TaxID=869890 RepID=A0ACC7DW47_9EURY|nr:NUDIX hydrolase [Halovenus rubra]
MTVGSFQSVPHETQRLTLSPSKLESLEPWATEGTALTAAARVEDDSNRIALIKNCWTDGWFLPGGAVERGESPVEAARREVNEETNLTVSVHDPLVVLDQTYVSRPTGEERFSARYVVYTATVTGTVDIPPVTELGMSADEIKAARWFESVPENLHDEELLRPYLAHD